VLLHSLGEDSSTWTDVAQALAVDRPVIAFDLPGHGDAGPRSAYSFEQIRNEVSAAIEALELDQLSIVGHSLGGMLGYLIAAQRPAWLAGLVLEEAPPPLPLDPPRPPPDRPEAELDFDWAALVALYRERNEPDPAWWRQLGDIEVPTLVLAGGEESHIDQDQMARMAERIPDATVMTIGGGHHVHTTRPDDFVVAVNRFLTVCS